MTQNLTQHVINCLEKMEAGDPNARSRLLEFSCERLRKLASQMMTRYDRVRRWEETDDVLSSAMIRLNRALETVVPESPRHFFRLAALQMGVARHPGLEVLSRQIQEHLLKSASERPQLEQCVS